MVEESADNFYRSVDIHNQQQADNIDIVCLVNQQYSDTSLTFNQIISF